MASWFQERLEVGGINSSLEVLNQVEWVEWAEASQLPLDILELSLKLNFSCNNSDKSIFNINWDFSIFIFGHFEISLQHLFSELIVLAWEDEVNKFSLIQAAIIVNIEEVNQNFEFGLSDGVLSGILQEFE